VWSDPTLRVAILTGADDKAFCTGRQAAGDDGKPTGETRVVTRDNGLRERESLANLKPVAPENSIHSAGTSLEISDGAAAVMFASTDAVVTPGLRPRARVVDA